MNRIPWLSASVSELEDGTPAAILAECLACHAQSSAPIASDGGWLAIVTRELVHAEACPVPDALRKARAAQWN